MLYPYQQQAVEFHTGHRYSLNCSEMGTGKSRIALATTKAAGARRVAIFGPAFLASTWANECRALDWSVEKKSYIPYSMLHQYPHSALREYDFWIADEVHALKSPTAKRTHLFYGALKGCLPKYFIGLTGTPVKNRVPDFWTLLAFCSLDPSKSNGLPLPPHLQKYYAFARHFCHSEKLKYGGRSFEKFSGLHEDKIPELKALLRDKYLRVTVEEVLPELPEITHKEVFLDLSTAGDEALQEAFAAYLEGRKATSEAKLKSATLKAPLTAEYCRGMLDEGSGPLLIFTDHVEPARIIASALSAEIVTGGTAMESRMQHVKDFQAGKIPALVATIGALSVGVTLTAARHVVFNDLSWTPSDNAQAEKRIHRIGQKNACWAHHMIATPTDSHIRKLLADKAATIKQIV